jgi:hypothetical protein
MYVDFDIPTIFVTIFDKLQYVASSYCSSVPVD